MSVSHCGSCRCDRGPRTSFQVTAALNGLGDSIEEGLPASTLDLSPSCFKCKDKTATVITRGLNACTSCFKAYIESSVRTNLRTKCSVARNSRVCIAVSGGSASAALLQIVIKGQHGKLENSDKHLGLDLKSIIYVDEPLFVLPYNKHSPPPYVSLPHGAKSDSKNAEFQVGKGVAELLSHFKDNTQISKIDLLGYVRETVHPSNSDATTICPINDLDSGQFVDSQSQKTNATNADNLKFLESQLASLYQFALQSPGGRDFSVVEDIVSILRDRALVKYCLDQISSEYGEEKAESENSLTLLLGHTGTRTSIESFQVLCKGGGVKLPFISRFVDSRFKGLGLTIAKPLKKLTREEVQQYFKLMAERHDDGQNNENFRPERVEHSGLNREKLVKGEISNFNINDLVKSFLDNLQSNNFQSIATASGTLDKLDSIALETCPKFGITSEVQTTELETSGQRMKYGRCRFCLGPSENMEAKETTCVWSSKQIKNLRLISPPNNEIEVLIDAPATLSFPQSARKLLCLCCIRLAASSPLVVGIINFVITQTNSSFLCLFS